MIRKTLFFLLFQLVAFSSSFGQILDPVTWTTNVVKVSDTEYDLIAKASIDGAWHLYAQDVPPNGPRPTVFAYNEKGFYELVGKTVEDEGETIDDPTFNMRIKQFSEKAKFVQRIKLTGDPEVIGGTVEFMVCNDEQCLPPTEIDLTYDLLKAYAAKEEVVAEKRTDVSKNTSTHKETSVAEKAANVTKKIEKEPELEDSHSEENSSSEPAVASLNDDRKSSLSTDQDNDVEVTNESTKKEGKRGLWSIFWVAFLSGFAALLTPCVFPMIPMTVSYFTKQSKNKAAGIRNGIFYGISIVLIYVILGSVVTAVFGAQSLNALATNVWFNLIFFALLVVFALSFLGAFEITLPSSWSTKIDSQADRSGLVGIFFMALALAVVSFSCTGPIVGTLLVEAASKGGIAPVVGMLGFSLAIAIPFALFAIFPGWLNSLPKSGGWLNTVKVVLGFLELALAFKFLSMADLVVQAHWLEREVFLAIWIAIFGTLAMYLFGKIKLPHDSPIDHISVGRLSLGLVVLAFTIYMIPGLWGAPLNFISAFPPPLEYSESPYGVGFAGKSQGDIGAIDHNKLPEGAHLMPPHDIVSFKDYDTGLAYAKKVNKPVMIDFTGHACANCRQMEQNVWPDPRVLKVLKEDVVLISLYVDDSRKLPKDQIVPSKARPGRTIRKIGQKWAELQILRYNRNSQPFYVLMDHNEENLVEPVAYTPDIEKYYEWLQSGLKAFK